jgi:hypothetical protein
MNKRGNPGTLVAAQPGNANADRHGVHAPRLVQARAAEIATELTRSFPRLKQPRPPKPPALAAGEQAV